MLHKNNKVRIVAQFGLSAVCVIFFVFLAFAGEAKAATYQCDSCGDCRSKINSAGSGDTVELTKDIWNTTDLETAGWDKACIIFNNKQNIIFDCRDYVIDGTSQNSGVYFSDGSNSNTIKNCYITGFQYGVFINYADSINFSYVTANYNSVYGIYFYGQNATSNSSSNTLSNITANNNSSSGIVFQYSSSNILNNITANNNGSYGICFQNSSSNTLNNIVANNNSFGFFSSGASTGNNLTNITANSNNSYGIYASQFNSGSFTNTTVNGNKSAGILLATSNLVNILTNITAVNNSWPGWNNYGIQLNDSDNNIIKDSVIKWNGDELADKDINIDINSSGNIFYNNQVISQTKINDANTGVGNNITHWNKWDSDGGDQWPGNLWEVFDQDGESCFDGDSDGYCDSGPPLSSPSTYVVDLTNSTDNYPKYINVVSAHYCNSRDDCNTKIAFAKAGDTVYLTKDILNYAGNCINLQNKTNLIFDCQGYTIDKDAATAGNGVYLDNGGANGSNTVKNCVITDFTIGVYALNSNQNTIVGNTVKANTTDVKLTTALNNVFYNNEFLNQAKITDMAANATVWDNGAAGNHWDGYDAPVENCNDDGSAGGTANDGYCDLPYTISSSGAKDNFAKYIANDPYSCATCEDCSAKIAAASAGDTIKLTKSIANAGATCVKFNNKQNITFDCQGYGIDGVGTTNGYGIYITGSGLQDNNIVENCYITQFSSGVYINSSYQNTIKNVKSTYNKYCPWNCVGYGIYINNSKLNTLIDVTLENNSRSGVYFFNSSSNILTNIIANNNGGDYIDSEPNDSGLYFTNNSNSNTLINIIANYNKGYSNRNGYGIYFSGSGGNTVKDSAGIKLNPININIASDNGVNGNKFYNNDFVSKNKITDLSPRTQWDDGAGAGNWWQSYDSGDEGCVDGGGDGICDAAYAVGSLGTKDNFPEWKKLNDDEYNCTDCASCTNAVANAMYGDKIILDNHIFGGALVCRTVWDCSCIDFGSYKEGLTFKSGCSTGDCIIQGPGNYYGIRFDGYNESNTIKNVIISNFSSGISSIGKSNKFNVFSDIMSSYNNGNGISMGNSSDSNTLTYFVVNNNSSGGILINSCANNKLTYSNLFNNSNYGIQLWGGGSHTVASSTIKFNATDVSMNSNNIFYNNQFTSKTKISDTAGANIWDNGIKGNWWEAYDADDDGCYDDGLHGGLPAPVAYDGYCDNRYEVKAGIYDRYPQYKGGVGVVYACSTCAECNSKIIQAKYGDTVQLTQDIFGAGDTCVKLEYKQGITLDCQNHLISGQSISNTYGVQIKGNLQNDYNTVKRCIVKKFYYGIIISNSYANTLDNITVSDNSIYGVFLKNSNFNTLANVTAKNHTSYSGIYFDGSDSNQLSQITVNNNGTGIYFVNSSDSNSVTASAGIKSNKTNVAIDTWSYGNIFYNNQFISKTKISDANTGVGNNITRWNKWDSALGDQEPGNQWEDYDTPVEGCSNNGLNYCVVKPYWKDKFPKYYGVVTDRTCNTCATCNTEIANAFYGEKITLTRDITGVSGDCVKLNYKEGVTFDCDNHKMAGIGADKKGIYLYGSGAEYNIIKNCDISSFGNGIYVEGSAYNTIENIISNYNKYIIPSCCYAGAGIVLFNNSNSNNLKNITAKYNYCGINILTNSNNLINATSTNNGCGVDIQGSLNNLTNITAEYNSGGYSYYGSSGILIFSDNNTASSSAIKLNDTDIKINDSSADNNKFYNNELVSKDKIVDNGTGTKWDNGITDGGNHWELFDTADEYYFDVDGVTKIYCTGAGAYCGNVYKIDNKTVAWDGGVSIDYYPKRAGAASQIYTCETCADCSAKIASSTAGDTIKLTKDIIGHSGTCVDFGGKSGIIFNCQDYIINGNNSASNYGVYVTGMNNTVKNCNISNFYYGIHVYDSPSNNLTDNNASYNSQVGVYVNCANHDVPGNNLSNITANYNGSSGVYLQGAGVNSRFVSGVINNITANYNDIGVAGALKDSVIKNSVITNNKTYGLSINTGNPLFVMSTNNFIFSNIIKWNTDGVGADKDIIINSSYTNNQTFYGNDLTSKSMITDSGTNIKWDNGLAVGGNHWDGYDSDNEGCKDVAPINGYCDSAYVIDANSKDNYPKYIGGISTFYCNSCADCNNKIASSSNGSTIYLSNNISDVNAAGNCLNFSDKKQNLIFNCQGYSLIGNGATGNGVYLNNIASAGIGANTVKNCVIKSFNKGVYIADSDNNIIASSTIKENIVKDIELDNLSGGNIFYANEFLNEGKMADSGTNTHWNKWTGVNAAPGNHWQNYDEPAELCDDVVLPVDGYCDTGYTLVSSSGAVDNYPKYVGAVSQYECNSCSDCNTKIAAAGAGDTIKLTANIVNHSGTCVTFNAKTGVTFDCQNYAIDGDNISNGSKGVYLKNSNNNNKIKNCRISGFNYGVYLENSDSNYLEVLDASNNKVGVNGYGVYLTSSGGGQDSQLNNLTNITANNNYSYGIYFQGGDTKWNDLINIIANYNGNSADSNSSGIYFTGAQNNNLTNITADYNIFNGIYFQNANNNTATSSEFKWNKTNIKLDSDSSGNIFYNNKLISKEKIDDTGTGTLWDNGVNLGNWWEAFDGDNENCFNDGGNICTTDYEVESGRFDRYPQYKGANFNKQNKTCNSCANCGSIIQSAYYGEKIKLTQDINTANADCVDFSQYKEGITLDCQSLYYISGTGGSSYKGVYIHGYGKENNTVQNCTILGFDYGIYVWYSDAVNLTNMEIYNSGEGIYIYSNAGNNILDDIKANYNRNTGVRIEGSNNIFKEISANNNERGLLLSGKGSNTLSSANEFKNNSQSGIQVWCSAGSSAFNTITDSVVKQNKENINIAVGCTLASGVVNLFYDNEFISKEKMADSGETTKWDNGSKGNWWEAFDWEDEGCYDSGLANGYCDNGVAAVDIPYWKDNHPKYKGPLYNQIYPCNSCADCSSKIQNARYGETVNLAQDIYTETDCVNFGNYKEGVTFDCDKGAGERYSIAGNAAGTGAYIKGEGVENHTIKNCQLRNFNTGIKLDGSDGDTINNVAANNLGVSNSYGINLAGADNNNLTDINVDYNNFGVYFTVYPLTSDGSDNNKLDNISAQYGYNISSCYVSSYEGGLYFEKNSNNNEITNSVIKRRNRSVNIADNTSQNNKFYNNHFVSEKKMTDNGTGTQWDNGVTGNWWEACGDADNNGICDAIPYWKDNFPKYEGGEGTVTTCTTCDDCNDKIILAKYGETVRLVQDIFLHSGTCVKFNYKEGVIFDGGGCLTGDCIIGGTAGGDGINVCGGGMENNKIENFDLITNFTNGIYINQSATNILENIAASNNKVGIYLYQSGGNYLINSIETNNNTAAGIYLSQSNLNLLNNIIANNNTSESDGGGLNFSSSNSNILTNITANNNLNKYSGGGLNFSSSNSNILTNITANNNLNKYSGGGLNFSSSNSNILTNIIANNNSLEKYLHWSGVYYIDKGGGIYFSSSNSNILTNVIAENNTMDSLGNGGGLSFNNSSNNKISFATSTGNYKDGIYFSGSNTNTIASSTVNSNSNKDINIVSGSGNIFHANEFISGDKMNDIVANSTRWNWWVGGANAKPGNHWDVYDTAGECCFDNGTNPDSCGGTPVSFWPYDGYCDNRYEIKTGVYDNYPIRKSVKPADFSITAAYAGSLTSNSTCENIIFWENNGDADEYNIYRSTDGIVYNKIDTVDYSKNNYIDSGVDYLNSYSYYIEARNGVFTTIADCDYGGGLRPYCEEDNGTETAALYPTICSADLAVSGVCSAVDLSWPDVTPTGNYYALRSDDGGAAYNNIYSVSDDNSSDPWTYQDTDASTSIDFYYKIQSCIGTCPSASKCQPTAFGPRDDCYAESNIETINPCQNFLMPTWKEVKP